MSGYNYESFGQCDIDAPDFWSVATIGRKAPDLACRISTATRFHCRRLPARSMCCWNLAVSHDRRLWGRFLR